MTVFSLHIYAYSHIIFNWYQQEAFLLMLNSSIFSQGVVQCL